MKPAVFRWVWRFAFVLATLVVLALWLSAAVLPRAWRVEVTRVLPAEAAEVSRALHRDGALPALLRPDQPAQSIGHHGSSTSYRWSDGPEADTLTLHPEGGAVLGYERTYERGWSSSQGRITLRALTDGSTAVTWHESGQLPLPLGGLFRRAMAGAVEAALQGALAELEREALTGG